MKKHREYIFRTISLENFTGIKIDTIKIILHCHNSATRVTTQLKNLNFSFLYEFNLISVKTEKWKIVRKWLKVLPIKNTITKIFNFENNDLNLFSEKNILTVFVPNESSIRSYKCRRDGKIVGMPPSK